MVKYGPKFSLNVYAYLLYPLFSKNKFSIKWLFGGSVNDGEQDKDPDPNMNWSRPVMYRVMQK